MCKIHTVEFPLSDAWIGREEFNEIGPDALREIIAEDILSFLEEVLGGILPHTELYWRDKA